MAYRCMAGLVVAATLLVVAPDARASLVYVSKPSSAKPTVRIARDDGTHGRKLGSGVDPVISPDGRYVAWRTLDDVARVVVRKVKGHVVRRVALADGVGRFDFSPNSRWLAVELPDRLIAYHVIRHSRRTVLHAHPRGFSFSPDSRTLVFGSAGRRDAADAPSDLYSRPLLSKTRTRITYDRKSLNPVWGTAGEIVFDRQTRRDGDAPKYNVFAIHPDGGAMRRITSLKIPSLQSGLVPLELSGDAKRLLAEFEGQDTSAGFAVNPATGSTRSLSRDLENGFVASDLSEDGRVVLGATGGPDPTSRHDVVTMPWTGGEPTVLVRRASSPDWTH
jgi:hypothetical protein